MSHEETIQEHDASNNKATANPVLSPEYILQNIIPVPADEMLCPICAFYDDEYCDSVPCDYIDNGCPTQIYWEKTPNFDNKFFDILWKHAPKTINVTMEQAIQKYMIRSKISELVSKNLTPKKCNKLYPECYSCDLAEHPDLCKALGCSCRNPNGPDFVNIVWKRRPFFDANNFFVRIGTYDKEAISSVVQMTLTKLIISKKLKDLKEQSL